MYFHYNYPFGKRAWLFNVKKDALYQVKLKLAQWLRRTETYPYNYVQLQNLLLR